MEKRVDERIKSIKVYVGGKGSEVLEKLIGDVIFFLGLCGDEVPEK